MYDDLTKHAIVLTSRVGYGLGHNSYGEPAWPNDLRTLRLANAMEFATGMFEPLQRRHSASHQRGYLRVTCWFCSSAQDGSAAVVQMCQIPGQDRNRGVFFTQDLGSQKDLSIAGERLVRHLK